MRLKSVKSIKNFSGKKILVRVDFNVPIKSGRVGEDIKIRRSLETVKYLKKNKATVVLASHLGRPGGKPKAKESLRPVSRHLSKLLGQKVEFNGSEIGSRAFYKKINDLQPGRIMLLENTRFYPGEKKNDLRFAKSLATGFDIFVNDAFAASHRAHASVVGAARFLPAYAGLNLANEVKNLEAALDPKKPLALVIGGAKISTKMPVIKKYLPKARIILLGGGLMISLLRADGYGVGSSLSDPRGGAAAKKLIKHFGKKIIIPDDVVIGGAKSKKKKTVARIGEGKQLCKKGEAIFDIGPKTAARFKKEMQGSRTIIWNGPMGLIEVPAFSRGTESVARAIAGSRAKSYVGGGETLMILNKLNLINKFTFVSTGGGAMLEFLEGKALPGLKYLIIKK